MGLFVDIKNAFKSNVDLKENKIVNTITATGKAIKNAATRTADVVMEETKALKTEVIGESKITRLERDKKELEAKMLEMATQQQMLVSSAQELANKMQQLIGTKEKQSN